MKEKVFVLSHNRFGRTTVRDRILYNIIWLHTWNFWYSLYSLDCHKGTSTPSAGCHCITAGPCVLLVQPSSIWNATMLVDLSPFQWQQCAEICNHVKSVRTKKLFRVPCRGHKVSCLKLQNELVAIKQSHLPCPMPVEALVSWVASLEADEVDACLISPYLHLSAHNLSHREAFIWNG